MPPRGPQTREQQIQYINGQLTALAYDIRQAKADDDIAGLAILEQRRDELLDWRNRLCPPQREVT